ncbi:hypothetical protein PRELSG_0015700 [Plasmodium relictum]|uniref:Uncharacterized protein n=1 Tax=Plasmodium relictum TaxID=85471 RepID=A0A1J1GL76_PLARL|nr:hypothetical protein PRELSG_0015700 [Plasmodium relictum]CRG85836.1 hypothetical protein PRELSG_0015700 [Plasmodium relictum]
MNLLRAFNLLLVSNLVAFIHNTSLLSSLFKDSFILNNYELGFNMRRNLAEISSKSLEPGIREHRGNFFTRGLLKTYLSLEGLLHEKILRNPHHLNNMKYSLSLINEAFSREGITLSFIEVANIYYRVDEVNKMQQYHSPDRKRINIQHILSAQKELFVEYSEVYDEVVNIRGGGESKEIFIIGILNGMEEKLGHIIDLKLRSRTDLRLNGSEFSRLKYEMKESISNAVIVDRRDPSRHKKRDDKGVSMVEEAALRKLKEYIDSGKYDKKTICNDQKIVIKEIYSSCYHICPETSFEQYKRIYDNLSRHLTDLSSK